MPASAIIGADVSTAKTGTPALSSAIGRASRVQACARRARARATHRSACRRSRDHRGAAAREQRGDIERFDEVARLVAPVGRREQRRRESATAGRRRRGDSQNAGVRGRPYAAVRRAAHTTATTSATLRRAATPARAMRRGRDRARRSSRLRAIDRAPFPANQPLELVEQCAIALRDRVDERREERQRFVSSLQQTLHELAGDRALDFLRVAAAR